MKNISEKVIDEVINFNQPDYDKRTSCFVRAGDDHGIGKRQPVGSMEHNSTPAIPRSFKTQRVDEAS